MKTEFFLLRKAWPGLRQLKQVYCREWGCACVVVAGGEGGGGEGGGNVAGRSVLFKKEKDDDGK